jgi:thiamine pyrophosphate-dependent acetolactate synthase large subunit-like protein
MSQIKSVPSSGRLERRKVVARLLRDRKDLVVITSLGSPTYDVASAGDHDRNFYLWGAMGGAAMIGLGLALAKPTVPVMVLLGDGEALMGMGAFATIALQNPPNLSVIILDNELYGETGSQVSHTSAGADLAAIAAGCGIKQATTLHTAAEVEDLAKRIMQVDAGPSVTVIKIGGGDESRVLPSRDGVWLKTRVQTALGTLPG